MRWSSLGMALLVALASCQPKPPQPPQPAPVRAVAVWVPNVPNPIVYLDGQGTKTGDANGYTLWPEVPESLVYTFITIQAMGYEPYRADAVKLEPGNYQINVGEQIPPLVPLVTALPRLVLNGQAVRLETGEQFTIIEASGFTLYQQFLEGKDIEPVLSQLQQVGFNTVRVFGQYDNSAGIGHFRPENYRGYYTQRKAFFDRLAAHNLYGEWTQFADATRWTCAQQSDTAQGTASAFEGITNALVEWVNEADQAINQMCPQVLASLGRIPNVLTSRGSNGSQAVPVKPFLDYVSFHTNDAPEEERKVGHNCGIDFAPTACLTNETSKAPNKHNWTVNPTVFAEDAAAGAALLAMGATYHSEAGLAGRLLAGNELTYAVSWVKGAKKVPLTCQNQAYSHRTDLETPGVLRAYQRGKDPNCVVLIRKST